MSVDGDVDDDEHMDAEGTPINFRRCGELKKY